MSWTRIAAFYVLALLATFYLRSATEVPGAVETPAAEQNAPFLAAVPERIDRVRMENESLALQFEKRDGRWVTTEPEGLAPPGDVIDAILESLTGLPAIDIVHDGDGQDGKEGQEGQFGLIPARMRLRIEQEGALVSTIVIGALSPTRTAVYARKSGSDDVALIGLNSKYYMDLVFENVRRQMGSAGVPVVAPKTPGRGGPAAPDGSQDAAPDDEGQEP